MRQQVLPDINTWKKQQIIPLKKIENNNKDPTPNTNKKSPFKGIVIASWRNGQNHITTWDKQKILSVGV